MLVPPISLLSTRPTIHAKKRSKQPDLVSDCFFGVLMPHSLGKHQRSTDGRIGRVQAAVGPAQDSEKRAACSSTVTVAVSCLSGG
jgi:hypothetical protein